MAQEDPTQVDSKHYTVEHENEQLRVLRVRYGPHEKSVMHSHPALVGVALTDAHVRFADPEGNTEEISLEAGESLVMPPTDHLPENLSDTPFEIVLVELKG
jgi:quercetin dioxygenase-like cupin family protein